MHPPGFVASIRVVVSGEQISVFVESQLLRVPQPRGEKFKVTAIGVAAQYGAAFRSGDLLPFLRDNIEASIANAEIELPVRPEPQPMEVMAIEAEAHRVTVLQTLALIGLAVPIRVAQAPQVGDASEVNIAFARQDPGSDPRIDVVKTFGEHG